MNKKIIGTSLLELLIAMTLSLLLISCLLEIYGVSQRGYRLQLALNQLHDNAKTAIDILTTDLHQTGYIGCARLTSDFPLNSYQFYSLTAQNKLIGNEHEIMTRHAEFPSANLKKSMENFTTIAADKNLHFSKGNILLIADCKQAEIFQLANIFLSSSEQILITSQPLHHRYEQNAEVSHLQINRYFIGKTLRIDQDGTPIYSLYKEDINRHKIELIENISAMRIVYTVRQGGQLVDVPANKIADWSQVLATAIDLDLLAPPIKKTWHLYVALHQALV